MSTRKDLFYDLIHEDEFFYFELSRRVHTICVFFPYEISIELHSKKQEKVWTPYRSSYSSSQNMQVTVQRAKTVQTKWVEEIEIGIYWKITKAYTTNYKYYWTIPLIYVARSKGRGGRI